MWHAGKTKTESNLTAATSAAALSFFDDDEVMS